MCFRVSARLAWRIFPAEQSLDHRDGDAERPDTPPTDEERRLTEVDRPLERRAPPAKHLRRLADAEKAPWAGVNGRTLPAPVLVSDSSGSSNDSDRP